MSTAYTRSALELSRIELKLFLREPFAVFFTLLFPLILMFILGTVFGLQDALAGFRVVDLLVPNLIVAVTAYLGLMGLPIVIAEYREMGVLKRFRTTPLPLGLILTAHIAVQALMLLISSLLIVIMTWLVFGLRFGGSVPAVVLMTVIGLIALFSVGFAIAGLVNSSRTAQAVGLGLYFPLLFTSGAMVPRDQFPTWLASVTDYFPLTPYVDSMVSVWIGQSVGAQWKSILGLAVLAALGVGVARATFRWS